MDLVEGKDLGRVLRHRPLKDEDLTCEHQERGRDLGSLESFLMGHSVMEVFSNFSCFLHF